MYLDFDPVPNDSTDLEKEAAKVRSKIKGNREAEKALNKLVEKARRRSSEDWDGFW